MDYDFNQELSNQFKERIEAVNASIEDACRDAGRSIDEITLVGVSKVFPVECAEAAFCNGISNLGENKVQELVPKFERFQELGLDAKWHLIGTLQKNKVKYIIGKTHLIHSVNTVELAEEISKRSLNNSIVSDILIQANVSGEESKHGFLNAEVEEAFERISSLDGVRVRGLMTMAPIQQYEGEASITFAKTKELFDKLKCSAKDTDAFDVLSMGMSQDYRYAIKEGATHIRIGTAIFGDRSKLL